MSERDFLHIENGGLPETYTDAELTAEIQRLGLEHRPLLRAGAGRPGPAVVIPVTRAEAQSDSEPEPGLTLTERGWEQLTWLDQYAPGLFWAVIVLASVGVLTVLGWLGYWGGWLMTALGIG